MDFSAVTTSILVPLMQEMIRNQCVNDGTQDSGHETRSVATLERFFASYGIESEVLEAKPGRGNLIVRIPGKNPLAPSLCYMGHLDVVPASEEGWMVPPFSGELKDGHVWGRGAVDMLNMTSSMAVALALRFGRTNGKEIEEASLPEGDIVFVAVADEESGGQYGARWIVEEHWDKVRADYMIAELGGFFLEGKDGPALTVTVGEKGIAWARLRFSGTAGHGSMPYKSNNAAIKAAEATIKLGAFESKKVVHEGYRSMVNGLALPRFERVLLNSQKFLNKGLRRLYQKDRGIAKFLHTATRMTMSPNTIKAGEKINIIADASSVELDVRLLPGQGIEDVQQEIRKALGTLAEEVHIEFVNFFPANLSNADTPLMKATESIVNQVHPLTNVVPFFIGGVTDGRYWRQRGTVVYGFSLFDTEMTMSLYSDRIHSKNERISVASLEKSLQYFYLLPDEFYRQLHR